MFDLISIVITIIDGIFKWYALYQILLRGTITVSFNMRYVNILKKPLFPVFSVLLGLPVLER